MSTLLSSSAILSAYSARAGLLEIRPGTNITTQPPNKHQITTTPITSPVHPQPGFQLRLPLPSAGTTATLPSLMQGDAVHPASFLLCCTFPPIQCPTEISRAHKQHTFSCRGKDLETPKKEWLNLCPDSSSQGRCALTCLKIHSSIMVSFIIILSWKHFHLSVSFLSTLW